MKVIVTLLVLIVASSPTSAQGNPVQKVLELLSSLQAKIIKEGEDAKTVYDGFVEWCDDRSTNLGFQIKTSTGEIEALKASIEKAVSDSSEFSTTIEELAGSTAANTADLKKATEIRGKEAAEFAKEEAEMTEIIGTLERAISVLTKEMQKGDASMLQLHNADGLAKALDIMVDASMFTSADASRLTEFLQSGAGSDDTEISLGAPAAAVYKTQGGGIIETLEGLLDKATEQLGDARKKETTAIHNFQMLQQALEDELKFQAKDMASTKANLAAAGETKAAAEKDLAVASKSLAEAQADKETLHQDCTAKAQEFEESTTSRGEELKALAEAKKVVAETTGGAESLTYGLAQVSLVQVASRSKLESRVDLANFEAVRFIKDLARKQNDPSLNQLASRMASAIRFGARDAADPFAKVRGLISDMLARLESTAQAEASHKKYCDKELAESKAKESDKSAEVSKMTTDIDKMSARSAQLKDEIAVLQKELTDLAAASAAIIKLRAEENAAFRVAKVDTEEGLKGVQMAIQILRDYYADDGHAHAVAAGAGNGIIGLLEVVEADFSKGLAATIATEEAAAAAFERQTQEDKIMKTVKDQDVKYKVSEAAALDKAIGEVSSDRESAQDELDAIHEYLEKLTKMCVAKAEPYEERKERREAEIAGLKQALAILEGEAVLLQSSTQRTLRGAHLHRSGK